MANLFLTKTDFANSIKSSNKKNSHTKFISTSNLLENSDFKKFLELYLNDTTEFFERLDGYDGFISTQQVESINYENFEEHIFFDSAVEKINYSYDQAINFFPYDKTSYEMQQYIKSLDGFTKFILDEKVKKKINYLSFDGNMVVQIDDKKGSLLNDYIGSNIYYNFNPRQKPFSFDFWLYPELLDDSDICCLFKKYSVQENTGFIIYIDQYNSNEKTCRINFKIDGNITSQFTKSLKLKTGIFQHICFDVSNIYINNEEIKTSSLYLNGKKLSNEYLNIEIFGDISELLLSFNTENFNQEKILIGHSNNETVGDITFTKGFVGHIDEFRFFIGQDRSEEDVLREINENINARESLVLYYRFNEPAGQYANNNISLDFSGNKLHGITRSVNNFVFDTINNYQRNDIDPNINSPLKYESLKTNPILFSSFSQESKEEMLDAAREYDLINPNSFWKLFPKNIFLEGSDFDNINEVYISESTKKPAGLVGTERSINHEIIKLISIWARFFDQIKIYIDSFSEILNFSYDSINKNKKIDGMILPLALNQLGFSFRELYPLPIREKLESKNLSYEEVTSALSIRQIQNVLWKRFILNSKDYLMAKGTKKSLKSVFNSFGLESDKFVRIRELTAQNNLNIKNQYENLFRNVRFLDFNRHQKVYESPASIINSKYYSNRVLISSGEISKIDNDNSWNFGNEWTYETYIKFDKNKIKMLENSQSLFRLDGRANDDIEYTYISPIIDVNFSRLNKNIDFGNITLSIKTSVGISTVVENNINLLNGCVYHLTLRKSINNSSHKYLLEISPVSHLSYIPSRKIEIDLAEDVVQNYDVLSFNTGNYNYDEDHITDFQGCITQMRIYSSCLKDNIIDIKSREIFYIGTGNIASSENDLLLNIDFSNDFSLFTNTIDGKICNSENDLIKLNYTFKDYHISPFIYVGDGLLSNNQLDVQNIIITEYISAMKQSNDIDSVSNSNKVYINSFENEEYKKQSSNKNISGTGQLHPDYLYHEDQRLYIDFSAVTFLNEDISKLIAVNDFFTETISNSSNLYEEEYIDLKSARDVYFKRLKKGVDINFDMLYQIYKYFDNILEDLLYESIPSRVNYLGFNFVYESHILERNKYQHKNNDSRIPMSSSELLKYQNYDSSNIKYRYDDSIGIDISSVLKKV